MAWKQSYFLPELSPEQIKLVTNPWIPYNAYHDPPLFSQPSQVHNITHYSSTLHYSNENQGRIYPKLSDRFGRASRVSTLFKIDRNSRKNVEFKIEAVSTTSQTLSNFSDAIKSIWSGSTLVTVDGKGNSGVATKQWIQNRLQKYTTL
jgi:hypothetical protein